MCPPPPSGGPGGVRVRPADQCPARGPAGHPLHGRARPHRFGDGEREDALPPNTHPPEHSPPDRGTPRQVAGDAHVVWTATFHSA